MGEQYPCSYEFGPFRVDPLKRVLWRGADPVALTSRAFETLLILIQNAGATLSKEEIIERVWGDTVVEENNLTQCISALRRTFGEGRSDHRFIVTVPGRGYRFVAKVETVTPGAQTSKPESGTEHSGIGVQQGHGAKAAVQSPPSGFQIRESKFQISHSESANPKSKIRNRVWLAAPIVAFAALGVVWLIQGASKRRRAPTNESAKPPARAGRKMLAVLPFENLTGDPREDYFSDGFTEEVITQLGRLDPARLGVIARTSVVRYKRSDENVSQIARDLSVGYILEGSVRRSGDRVRISAQLIKASDQTHVWAQSYERPLRNALELQETVARDVEQHIANRLDDTGIAAQSRARPVDPAAYQAYLEGLYFLNRRDLADYRKAITEFEAAIAKDRRYAPAYAGLADGYTLLALEGADAALVEPKAWAAAHKAVALDPSLAEGHTALAAISVLYRLDWRTAEREFKRALGANPNYALAHLWYAVFYLGPQGRYADAIAEMQSAQQLDPVSLIVNTDLGWAYFIAGRRDEAFAQYQEALRLNQRFVPVHYRLFEYYVSELNYPQALRELALDEKYSGDTDAARRIEQEYRASGFAKFLGSEIEAEKHGRSRVGPLGLARNYALLGRSEEAIGQLTALFQQHDPSMIYLKVDPELASLHSDPRFQDLERRCGLNP